MYNKLTWLISKNYRINWYLDSLPAGIAKTIIKGDNKYQREITYNEGIAIGYIADSINDTDNNTHTNTKTMYIYNHYRMYVSLYKGTNDKYQVVGFEIEPFSIKTNTNNTSSSNVTTHQTVQELINSPAQALNKDEEISFTYDVIFRFSNITFASRFDHYTPTNQHVHWFGIINSNILILTLTILTIFTFTRAIKQDIEIYNTQVSSDEIIDEYGWKQVSNDVFRKPINSEFLSAFIGSGIQILIMILYVLFFSILGFFQPEARGSVLTMMVMIFVFLSVVGGYINGRIYKTFRGRNWIKSAIITALLFPGCSFILLMLINWVYRLEGSNVVMGFSQICSIMILWICCSFPLVLIGTFIGVKQKGMDIPCKINPVPSPIPDNKPWYFHIKYACFITGVLPFGAVFVEFIYIMSSIWRHELFFFATFVMIAVAVLLVTSSEIGLLYVYVNLCKGDYNWWWKCFIASASPVIYVVLYSIYYFFSLGMTRLSTMVIYFGLMSLIVIVVGLVCGSAGVCITFLFLRKIYSMIKVD